MKKEVLFKEEDLNILKKEYLNFYAGAIDILKNKDNKEREQSLNLVRSRFAYKFILGKDCANKEVTNEVKEAVSRLYKLFNEWEVEYCN